MDDTAAHSTLAMGAPVERAPAAVELRGVSKAFGGTSVLEDVCLSAAPGEFLSLLGPSGCGKSTTLRILAGLERPTTGRVLFGGKDVTHATPAVRNVAMVFQSYALYPHMSVRQNIGLPLAMARLSRLERLPGVGALWPGTRRKRTDIATDVDRAARALGLDGLLDRRPSQLSGGQKQRVALARSLVRDPSVFLLDEPLSNLDARLRVSTREEIVDLHRRTGRAFVYVTHDQAEAMAMSDRIAVFSKGRIVQTGTPAEIFAAPETAWVAGFVGEHAINLIQTTAIAHSGALGPPFHGLRLRRRDGGGHGHGGQADGGVLDAGAIVVGLRPDALSPDPIGHLRARVRRVEYLGTNSLVTLAWDGAALRMLVPSEAACPAVGEEVPLAANLEKALLFDTAGQRVEGHLAPSDTASSSTATPSTAKPNTVPSSAVMASGRAASTAP
ncbi:MAG: ABC transporter ATP-binding protein [Pseudomonadota bacterium]